MRGEIDLFGLLVPELLLYAVAALAVQGLLSRVLGALGCFRWVWHPALVQLALYFVCLTGMVVIGGWIES